MFTLSYPVCPDCSSRLRGGWPSFGPDQVKCGYCGSLISTGLNGWNHQIPFPTSPALFRKSGLVLTELLFPTCMGYKEAVPRFLVNLALISVTLGLPIFQVVRLIKMRRESIRYQKTKVPPVWKWIYRQVIKT